MSNSSLVSYTKLVKNYTPMTNKVVKKITIHHMAGKLSLESCANCFNGTRKASSNYAIDNEGRIALYVEEHNRAWTSSSSANDSQAVTIEVANETLDPNWTVSAKAMASLINLCEDICRRNGIKELNFTGDKTGNVTLHKFFANTACPGPYLESKIPYIVSEVNKRLGGSTTTQTKTETGSFKVKVSITNLNIRKGPGTNYEAVSLCPVGIFTITESKEAGGYTWGKLKSGAGWIALKYAERV